MSEPALFLEGVTKSFGYAVPAVNKVDLAVARGEVFGFLGPNGAGKTTTLRMITGLLQPTAGRIEVCGVDALRDPIGAKQQIGFISDRPFIYDKLTGAEFLRFVGGLWGMSSEQIEQQGQRWLARFELSSWGGEPVESYSHGMRQRLLLCAALLHQPALLIMDEPMVGLDPRGAARLKEVVRELASGGVAVMLSTHTLDVVEQVCDSLAIINHGEIIAAGPVKEVRQAHGGAGRLEELFLDLTAAAETEDELGASSPLPPEGGERSDG